MRTSLCILSILLVSLGTWCSTADAQVRVGVVDIERVVNNSEERAAWVEAQRQKMDELGAELQRDMQRLQQIDQQLQNLRRESDEYRDLRREAVLLQASLNARQQVLQGEQRETVLRFQAEFIRRVQQASAEVARERELDLIMRRRSELPDAEELMDVSPERLQQIFDNHDFYYISPQLDVTSEVITKLNEMYRQRRDGAGD